MVTFYYLFSLKFRIFTAPFQHVGFADFWLADQLNSLAVALLDFQFIICFYAHDWHVTNCECSCYIIYFCILKCPLFLQNKFNVSPLFNVPKSWSSHSKGQRWKLFLQLIGYRLHGLNNLHLLKIILGSYWVIKWYGVFLYHLDGGLGNSRLMTIQNFCIFSSLFLVSWQRHWGQGAPERNAVTKPALENGRLVVELSVPIKRLLILALLQREALCCPRFITNYTAYMCIYILFQRKIWFVMVHYMVSVLSLPAYLPGSVLLSAWGGTGIPNTPFHILLTLASTPHHSSWWRFLHLVRAFFFLLW